MDEFKLSDIEERIESILVTIIHNRPDENLVTPSLSLLEDLKCALNHLFSDAHILCTNVIFTNNTDKPFFGVMMNPAISGTDAMAILATDDVVKLAKYEVELDSKLFNLGLDTAELASTLIYEISSMMVSNGAIENTRAIIDLNNLKDDDVIYLRDSANYAQLIIYALKDTLYKVSSIMFKTDIDEIISNQYIQVLDLQDFIVSAQQKVSSSIFGVEDTLRDPKASVMNWMLLMYKDMQHNSRCVKDTLKDAKEFTGSRLVKQEIDKTLECVGKIDNQIVVESTVDKFFDSNKMTAVNELSIFQSLKRNGLRSIEDALYEYAMRLKTCETEEDAMYILRGINTRLNILEDYLYSNPDISDSERKHWEDVAKKYRALREELGKKKLWNKKQYGLFFDYSQLDNLDEVYTEQPLQEREGDPEWVTQQNNFWNSAAGQQAIKAAQANKNTNNPAPSAQNQAINQAVNRLNKNWSGQTTAAARANNAPTNIAAQQQAYWNSPEGRKELRQAQMKQQQNMKESADEANPKPADIPANQKVNTPDNAQKNGPMPVESGPKD